MRVWGECDNNEGRVIFVCRDDRQGEGIGWVRVGESVRVSDMVKGRTKGN